MQQQLSQRERIRQSIIMKFCSLLLFLGLVAETLSRPNNCPSREDIYPCKCLFIFDKIKFECKYEQISLNDLKSILSHFLEKKNNEIRLVGLDLRNIPYNLFEGLKVSVIKIEKCKIDSLEDGGPAFYGLEDSLQSLDISSSLNKKNIPIKLNFGHLRQLTSIMLANNEITELDNNWIGDGLPSLKHLQIMINDIEKLGDKAFKELTNLEMFTLTDNNFGFVQRHMLPIPAKDLWHFDLSHNGLEILPEDLFESMPSLLEVLLWGNNIKTLERSTFEPILEQLDTLDVQENPIQCDSKLTWMTDKRLPEYFEGTCQGPADKKGLSLREFIEGKK